MITKEVESRPLSYAKACNLDARHACRRDSFAENSLKKGLDRVDDSIGQILDDVKQVVQNTFEVIHDYKKKSIPLHTQELAETY